MCRRCCAIFVDTVKITIKAGDGGNGSASFRRTNRTRSGGPDGGDGGKGGNVYFVPSNNVSTLSSFRYKKIFKAENGKDGRPCRASGKSGEHLTIMVPFGTLIKDIKTGKILADISETDESRLLCRGGRGGWGNTHFVTSTRQTPHFAKPGVKGEEKLIELELKLLADVCLIGYPSVGKSTFIRSVTNAKPTVGSYHFVTLTPVLGVTTIKNIEPFVIADLPGLI